MVHDHPSPGGDGRLLVILIRPPRAQLGAGGSHSLRMAAAVEVTSTSQHDEGLEWSVWSCGNSDHLPITTSFTNEDGFPNIPRYRCSYMNIQLVDWVSWTDETESQLARLPRLAIASSGEKAFRQVLLDATKHHIPMGYRKSYRPGLCRETRDLMKERDRRREQNDNDPSLIDLQARIDKLIHDSA